MIGTAPKDFSMLSDQQLQQAMMFAQRSNNTPEFLQLMGEASKRKQARQEAQGVQAGQQLAQGPKTQADAVMSGIANLSAPSVNKGYANGGIVSFSGGGSAASFGEFLRVQGIQPGDFSRLPQAAQDTLRQLFNNATMGPQPAAPAAPAAAAPAASTAAPAASTASSTASNAGKASRGISALLDADLATLPGKAWDLAKGAGSKVAGFATEGAGRAALPLASMASSVKTYNTPTDAMYDRMGIDREATVVPQWMKDTGVRTLGSLQDFGNNITFGLADRLGNVLSGNGVGHSSAYGETPTAPAPKKASPDSTPVPTPEPEKVPDKKQPSAVGKAAAGGASGTGIAALASSKESQAAAAAPPATPAEVEKTLTAEELRAKAEAMAKGDNEKVDAIYAKAAERDAKRREALDAETSAKEGWLGGTMSPEVRKMLRDAGIAMLTSKRPDAMGGIGEGLAAAAKGYEEGKQRRQDRLDALDAADEKRQLAKLAAAQGNSEQARKYLVEADALHQQAVGNALKKDELSQKTRHEMAMEQLQREQIAATLKGHMISAGAAGRNHTLELVSALGGGDVNKGWDVYNQGRGAAGIDKTLAAALLKDPLLSQTNPELYAKLMAHVSGTLGADTAAPTVRAR